MPLDGIFLARRQTFFAGALSELRIFRAVTIEPYIPPGRSSYYVRFQMHGKTVMLSLKTTSLYVAKKRAAGVVTKCGDEKFLHPRAKKPEPPPPPSSLGKIISTYLEWAGVTLRCRRNNILQLLHIVCPATRHVWEAQPAPLNPEHAAKMRQARKDRMAAVEAAKAGVQTGSSDVLTAKSISDHIAAGLAAGRRPSSINSDIRQARSVFCREALDHYKSLGLVMPESLQEFLAAKRANTKNDQKDGFTRISRDILGKIDQGIAAFKVSNFELWKALMLGRLAALRNNEILFARREWLHDEGDGKALLEIGPTDEFVPKGKKTCFLRLRGELAAALLAVEPGKYLVAPELLPTQRYNLIYRETATFLRPFLVGRTKAFYELRKAAGSAVAAKHGIRPAQLFLRHGSARITEKYYLAELDVPEAIEID